MRSPGGGRKPLTYHDPTLLAALEALVEPTSRGDPESPLRWTCKSVRQLAAELQRQGHQVGRQKVAELLADLAYELDRPRRLRQTMTESDRNRLTGTVLADPVWFGRLCIFAAEAARKAGLSDERT